MLQHWENMAMKVSLMVYLLLSLLGLNRSLYRKHYYNGAKATWSNAQQFCKNYYGGDLSIMSNEDLKPLSDNPQVTDDFYWIGLRRDPQNSVVWRWTGGEEATNIRWDDDEPTLGESYCAAVSKSTAKVHDAHCSWTTAFYCMEVFELILVQQESTWEEALGYCRQNYIDLAVLSSDVIMKEAKDKSGPSLTGDVWIGLRFLAGHWFWVNGEGLGYKVWSSGELQCPAVNQRCGVYDVKNKVWKPADCERRLNFLCVNKIK